MRINILANAPWARTGYGVQTALFAPRIKALGYEVSITAYYGLEGAVLTWNDMPVFPKAYDPYANDIMSANAKAFNSDIMLTNMDTWVIQPERMIHAIPWVAWMPVDHEPLPDCVKDKITKCFARIVYTRFAEKMLNDAGLDCYFVPMGVNTKVYKPIPRDETRKVLGANPNTFVVGLVAMNKGQPARKAFEPQLRAFAEFHEKHPDTGLYLHTQSGAEMAGIDLKKLVQRLGIEKCVQFCDQYQNVIGFNDDYMVAAYNSMDVLLLVSMGEGFGIPLIEAQACGTPVIAGDWTSTGELVFSGWKIPKKGGCVVFAAGSLSIPAAHQTHRGNAGTGLQARTRPAI
jgi:glycosyltransferase involved in cell wall biosynthesis